MMTMRETLDRIALPVPRQLISALSEKGRAQYVKWYDACDLMDERAPSWCSRIVREGFYGAERGAKGEREDKTLAFVVIEVTIQCTDGVLVRSATGTDDEPDGQRGTPLDRAESAALRRAFVKFGLARELYQGAGAVGRQGLIAERLGLEPAAGGPGAGERPEPRATAAPQNGSPAGNRQPVALEVNDPRFWARQYEECLSTEDIDAVDEDLRKRAPVRIQRNELVQDARSAALAMMGAAGRTPVQQQRLAESR